MVTHISMLSNYFGETVSPIAQLKFMESVFDTDNINEQHKYGI